MDFVKVSALKIWFNKIVLGLTCILIQGCAFMDQSIFDSQANKRLDYILTFGYHPCQDATPDTCKKKEIAEFKALVKKSAKKPLNLESVGNYLTSQGFQCFKNDPTLGGDLKCIFLHRNYQSNLLEGRDPGWFYLWVLNAKVGKDKRIKISADIRLLGDHFKNKVSPNCYA